MTPAPEAPPTADSPTAATPSWRFLATGDGHAVPLCWFTATPPRANIVLMAALGVAARFYLPLAEALRGAGCNVALVEQRGHGESTLRMADDSYAPKSAMDAVCDRFQSARVTRELLTAAQLDDRADHFRWVRSPKAVVKAITHWLDKTS